VYLLQDTGTSTRQRSTTRTDELIIRSGCLLLSTCPCSSHQLKEKSMFSRPNSNVDMRRELLQTTDVTPQAHEAINTCIEVDQGTLDCDTGEFILVDRTNDDEYMSENARRKRTFFTVVRAVVTIAVIALIIWALVDALTTKNIEEWLVTWISIVTDHMFIGMFILVAIYIVAGVLFVPQPLLSIGVGYAFGQAFPNMLYLSIPMSICVSVL
jgi:hypothetical protein